MHEIILLTGEIHSGKTTSLLQWSEKRQGVHGILSPVINGERMFMDISTKECFRMEASSEEAFLAIGRYRFSKAAFEKAGSILISAADKQGWLIIDEIGPLELKKEGFYATVAAILDNNPSLKLVLVVRSAMHEQVIHHFGLEQFSPRIVGPGFFNAQPV